MWHNILQTLHAVCCRADAGGARPVLAQYRSDASNPFHRHHQLLGDLHRQSNCQCTHLPPSAPLAMQWACAPCLGGSTSIVLYSLVCRSHPVILCQQAVQQGPAYPAASGGAGDGETWREYLLHTVFQASARRKTAWTVGGYVPMKPSGQLHATHCGAYCDSFRRDELLVSSCRMCGGCGVCAACLSGEMPGSHGHTATACRCPKKPHTCVHAAAKAVLLALVWGLDRWAYAAAAEQATPAVFRVSHQPLCACCRLRCWSATFVAPCPVKQKKILLAPYSPLQ